VQMLRGFVTWLKNGSDLNFRHLSHINMGRSGGGGLVFIAKSFLLVNLLPTFF
jgi:hypothetical protein